MGFNLSYFNSDFIPIDASGNPGTYSLMGDITNSDISANSSELFNGNIRSMQTTLRNITTGSADYLGNAYEYDQLNRLLKSRSFANYNPGNNTWGSSGTYDNKYYNEFSYDANGNILTQKRYTSTGSQLDDLYYNYEYDNNGRLVRNRLYHVDDAIATVTANELNDQAPHNYNYDQEGRLIKDVSEGLSIQWRVDGKIKSIIDSDDPNHYLIEFNYDAMGNRIAKRTYNDQFELIKCTYYSLDAQGNTIATYDHKYENQTVGFVLEERYIYGSSRLGAYEEKVDMLNTATQSNPTIVYNANRVFESSNHLGNVLVTFRDILNPIETTQGAQVTGYRVEIASTADYSPFGVQLDGRTQGNQGRFGFQGQESDDEIKGEGNSVNYKYRMHDPRVGRFFAVDPLESNFPWNSPYAFSENSTIAFIEAEGLEKISYTYTLETGTRYENNWPSWVPFSDYKNYIGYVKTTGIVSNINIENSANIVYEVTLRIPTKYVLSGTEAKTTDYIEYVYKGKNLEGMKNPENWVAKSNLMRAFKDGFVNGMMVGTGDELLEGAMNWMMNTYKLTGVASIAKYNAKLAQGLLKAEKLVSGIATKIELATPKLVLAVEKVIKGSNGKILTDFDIETTKHIIEVTGGKGKAKLNQIQNRLQPNSGGKEVILFGPNLGGEVIKSMEKNGIKVFTDSDKLIEYISKG